MNLRTIISHVVLPLVVVIVGVAGMRMLVAAKPEPPRKEAPRVAPLVEVVGAAPASGQRAVVRGMGTVQPARIMVLTPEVSGRVTEHHAALEPGGRLHAGDIAVQIDDRDYRLAVKREGAMVTRAQAEVALESGRQAIAQQEWSAMEKQLGPSATGSGRQLALRAPQGKAVAANVTAARAALSKARLALDRTAIQAPFDAFVQTESVEVGQWVGPGTPLATLVGTEHFWVEVSVPVGQLSWLGMGAGSDNQPKAHVAQRLGGEASIERTGRVVRVLDQLDPLGRMARLLIEVDDPLGLSQSDGRSQSPLRVGAYVEVSIEGKPFDSGSTIPRDAVRDGGKLWVVSEAGTLDIREIEVLWKERDRVVVGQGLRVGEQVIVSAMGSATTGMSVRLAEDATAKATSGEKP